MICIQAKIVQIIPWSWLGPHSSLIAPAIPINQVYLSPIFWSLVNYLSLFTSYVLPSVHTSEIKAFQTHTCFFLVPSWVKHCHYKSKHIADVHLNASVVKCIPICDTHPLLWGCQPQYTHFHCVIREWTVWIVSIHQSIFWSYQVKILFSWGTRVVILQSSVPAPTVSLKLVL